MEQAEVYMRAVENFMEDMKTLKNARNNRPVYRTHDVDYGRSIHHIHTHIFGKSPLSSSAFYMGTAALFYTPASDGQSLACGNQHPLRSWMGNNLLSYHRLF